MISTNILVIRRMWISILRFSDGISDLRKILLRPLLLRLLKFSSFLPEQVIFPVRILLARLLPWDPLSLEKSCSMSLYLLTTRKDLDVLPYSLTSVIKNIASNESVVTVVSPHDCISEITLLIKNMGLEDRIDAKSDESILEQFDLKRDDFPNGHSLMQVLKFLCVLSSQNEASIVLDGDTVFLRRRVWATENKAVLVVPPEYQASHVRFVTKYFPTVRKSRLGFTTQAQVMNKEWVEEMFNSVGGFKYVISSFTGAMRCHIANVELDSFPCEWQFLGDWLMTHKRESIEVGSYLNMSSDRNLYISSPISDVSEEFLNSLLRILSEDFPSVASLSLHAYKTSL
jgi:hypothetical protein